MADAVVEIPIPGPKTNTLSGDRERLPAALPGKYFLAGPENRLVEVVVRSILRGSPNGYNPVTLCGPTGAGKSHLAQGLAAAWKAEHRRQRVIYATATDFSRELAEAIETHGMEEFREKYRQAAFVVIEDLHRFGRKGMVPFSSHNQRNSTRRPEKPTAQEELVHTLDALVRQGAWLLATTQIAPGECQGMLPMLQSRLMGGLVVPLALPSLPTRRAIIQQQSNILRYKLPEPTTDALAERMQGTVQEIQEALARLKLPVLYNGKRIGAKTAQGLFDCRAPCSEPALHKIAALAARHFGLKLAQLRGPSRKRNIVNARDLAIYLARQLFKSSLEEIGRFFGGRDHTTIMYSCRKIETLVKTDAAFRRELESLKKQATATL